MRFFVTYVIISAALNEISVQEPAIRLSYQLESILVFLAGSRLLYNIRHQNGFLRVPMTTSTEEWLWSLMLDSDDGTTSYRNWGFTIYRTGYGPSSDQQWERLLQKIHAGARKGALSTTETTEEDPGFQQVWSLFRLDPRSDAALASLDIDQLRDLYNTGEGG